MATRARRPTLWPSEETCVHPRREDKEELGEKHGEGKQRSQRWKMPGHGLGLGLLLPHHLSVYCTRHDLQYCGTRRFCESQVSPSLPSSSSPWVLPCHVLRCLIGETVFFFWIQPFLEIEVGSAVIRKPLSSLAFLPKLGHLYRNGPLLKAPQTRRQDL